MVRERYTRSPSLIYEARRSWIRYVGSSDNFTSWFFILSSAFTSELAVVMGVVACRLINYI